MPKIFNSINSVFEKLETQFGRGVIALLIGFVFLFLASMVTAVRFDTFYHGNGFTRLSLNPFEYVSENDLRYRILSPLLGYVLHLRGPLFKYFMLSVLAIFFGFIYFFMRREKYFPSEAIGITAIFVFSTLSFYQFYFPAYTDPLSFLLVLFFMFLFRNKLLNILLLTLMLFNHENTVFLFPFFFLLSLNDDYGIKNFLNVSFRFVIAIIPYLAYRKFISTHAHVEFSISYYFDAHNMEWTRQHVVPHLLSGVFQAFRLSWIFLLAAVAVNVYEKRYKEILLIGVIMIFVLSQLAIAWDISRLVGMAFPAILISVMRMRTFLGSRKFLLLTYSIVLINFIIPAYCIGALDPIPYAPFWLR